MTDFQREVGEWAEQTFPQSTPAADRDASVLRGGEVAEAADCYLLLLHYAHKRHFDLEEAAAVKHLRNTRRQWGQPDSRGVVRHTQEAQP